MKKIVLILLLPLLVISCEKERFVAQDEIPKWLKDRIEHDEMIIASNPQSGLDCAAWIRYKYEKNYYFEYINMLSSSGPQIYDYSGTRYFPPDIFDYQENRCCKMYVWKGSWYWDD